MLDLENQFSYNFKFTKPIRFKDCVDIYPVKFKDIDKFKIGVNALLYNPLDYPDLELSSLPRLYFLTSVFSHINDLDFWQRHSLVIQLQCCLEIILKLVVGEEKYEFVPNGDYFILRLHRNNQDTSEENSCDWVDINSTDFNYLRELILQQNGCDYCDEFIHADIRRYLAEEDERERANEDSITTDEDGMEAVMLEIGVLNEESISELSMRRYNHLLSKLLSRERCVIQTTAAMSGFVKFEDKIPHWLGRQKMEARYKKAFKRL